MLKSAMKCCRKLQLKWNDCKRRGTKNVEEALSLATEYEKVVNDDLNGMTEILDKISGFSLIRSRIIVQKRQGRT